MLSETLHISKYLIEILFWGYIFVWAGPLKIWARLSLNLGDPFRVILLAFFFVTGIFRIVPIVRFLHPKICDYFSYVYTYLSECISL